MPAEVQSDEVALKWTNPISNGADITQYTVYIRNVSSNGTVGDWRKLEVIHDVSVQDYVITLKKDQQYEFVVTATNKYGESLKGQQNLKRIRVLRGNIMVKLLLFLRIILYTFLQPNFVCFPVTLGASPSTQNQNETGN